MPAYEFRHVASFGETSLVGNVYFSHYFDWQGRCRESFLRDECPEVMGRLTLREIAFFTRAAHCDFVGDWGFHGLDEVLVRMRLAKFRGGRMSLDFTYSNVKSPDEVVARGSQEVSCKAQRDSTWYPDPFPVPLVKALQRFADTPELHAALEDALEFHGQRLKQQGPTEG
jgi:enediyne core biosynthesis thioesterase